MRESHQRPVNNEGTPYRHFLSAFIDLTAGSAGGIANVLVGQPLDTVKVKMQTFPHLYPNSVVCFKQTIYKENFRGLYSGTLPALIANIAENSVLFCAYGVCQNFVKLVVRKNKVEDLNPLENAFSGFFAGIFSTFTLCPTELVKCRLQAMQEMKALKTEKSSKHSYMSPWALTRQILKEEGILGLFHGFTSTLVREMPGYFFFFGGYEISRMLLTPPGKSKDEIGLIRTIICGGLGGVALWVAIFPADVIKSRIQISGSKESMLAMMRNIIQKEGIQALYKGLGPTVLRTIPSTGALFVTYEYTKKGLNHITAYED